MWVVGRALECLVHSNATIYIAHCYPLHSLPKIDVSKKTNSNGELGLLNQLHFLAVKPLAVDRTSHRDRDSLSPFAMGENRGNPIADLSRALVTRKGGERETSRGAKNVEYGEKK